MALYKEKSLRESLSNSVIEPQKIKNSVPTPNAEKVKQEEAKVPVKPKKSAEDKENRSEFFNNTSKVETPSKSKPIAMKPSPQTFENFEKEVPKRAPSILFEEVKDATVSLPHAVQIAKNEKSSIASMSGSQLMAFVKAEIAESVRDALH